MNRILRLARLKNRYFAIRNGESEANLISLVCGNPQVGVHNYGLTPNGREQVRESTRNYKGLSSGVLIYSSDFLSSRQTAKIVAETLGVGLDKIVLEPGLRERFFGKYERSVGFDYETVYKQEKNGLLNNDVESKESVLDRTSQVVADLEDLYDKKKIVLVSHGDPLIILQTAFIGMSLSGYRHLPYIGNGQIRELVLIHQ